MEATATLNKVCRELGVCPSGQLKELPVIRAAGIKYAHELWHNDSVKKIRMALYEDGVIVSCAIDPKGIEPECCYTSAPGQEEAYFAYQAMLADKGYKILPTEVEKEFSPSSAEIIERITAGADVK